MLAPFLYNLIYSRQSVNIALAGHQISAGNRKGESSSTFRRFIRLYIIGSMVDIVGGIYIPVQALFELDESSVQ